MSAPPARSPLRHRDFRWFYLGDATSTAGSAMAPLAVAFAVLGLTGSANALGWVVASWTVPMIALMLVGGAVADRLPRTLVLRGCSLAQAVAQGATAALVLGGHAAVWQLSLLQLVGGSAAALAYPALHAMVPTLLPEGDRQAAYLLLSQTRSALRVVAPAAAGALVAAVDPGWAIALDALSYVAAALCLGRVRPLVVTRPHVATPLAAELVEGLRYAHGLGWVLPGAALSIAYNAAIAGGIGVLGPVIARATAIGGSGWGVVVAAEALGVLCFAAALRRVTLRRPLVACHAGFLTYALPLAALAGCGSTWPVALAMLVAGGGSALNDLGWNLTVQDRVPEHLLSRIMAVDGFVSFLALPLGQLAVGPATALVGARRVEAGLALLVVVTFAVAMTVRALRSLTLTPSGAADV